MQGKKEQSLLCQRVQSSECRHPLSYDDSGMFGGWSEATWQSKAGTRVSWFTIPFPYLRHATWNCGKSSFSGVCEMDQNFSLKENTHSSPGVQLLAPSLCPHCWVKLPACSCGHSPALPGATSHRRLVKPCGDHRVLHPGRSWFHSLAQTSSGAKTIWSLWSQHKTQQLQKVDNPWLWLLSEAEWNSSLIQLGRPGKRATSFLVSEKFL